MFPPAKVMFIICSMLLWWTLDSVQLPMGVGRIFFRGANCFFSKFFQRGGKSGEIWLFPLEIKKTFFAEIFKIQGRPWPPIPTPMPLPLVIKRKVLKEALQWSGERKCKVTSIKPNWPANWTYNAITSLLLNDTFIGRTTDLEKTVNMNRLLIWLPVTTIADAFLHKGNVWAHDQLSTLWRNTRKQQTSQESNPCIRPKFPKSPSFIEFTLIMLHYAWT